MATFDDTPYPLEAAFMQRPSDALQGYYEQTNVSGSDLIIYLDENGKLNADKIVTFTDKYSIITTASLSLVTASYAKTASIATTASYVKSTSTKNADTASYLKYTNGVFNGTASYALDVKGGGKGGGTADTASYVKASGVDGTVASAKTSDTASYIEGKHVDGHVQESISSSYTLSASYAGTTTYSTTSENSISSSYISGSNSTIGSLKVVSGISCPVYDFDGGYDYFESPTGGHTKLNTYHGLKINRYSTSIYPALSVGNNYRGGGNLIQASIFDDNQNVIDTKLSLSNEGNMCLSGSLGISGSLSIGGFINISPWKKLGFDPVYSNISILSNVYSWGARYGHFGDFSNSDVGLGLGVGKIAWGPTWYDSMAVDTAITRTGPATLSIGNGTMGDSSGTLNVNNLIVSGSLYANQISGSQIYVTSSQLTVTSNILTLNASTPHLKYAGIEMYDSGSTENMASMLWDGEDNHFFISSSDAGYSRKLILGPDNTGDLTVNYIPMATGSNGLTNSNIYQSGSNVGIGTTTPVDKLNILGGNIRLTKLYVQPGQEYGRISADTQWGDGIGLGEAASISFLRDSAIGGSLGALVVNTNGNERLRVSSGGNVGIGTYYPSEKLHVVGAAIIGDTALPYLDLKTFAIPASGWQYKQIAFKDANDGELYSIGYHYPNLKFTVSGSRAMDIDNNGNVGIGTTTPSSKLTVFGNIESVDSVGVNIIVKRDATHYGAVTWYLDELSLSTYSYTYPISIQGSVISLQDKSGGRVGIGTTTPDGKLVVKSSFSAGPSLVHDANSVFKLDNYQTSLVFTLDQTAPYATSIQTRHSENDGGSYPIALNPLGGNVGIGTTTPTYKLQVNGSFAASTKSFVIPHPTKENKKLCYGSLESPYHGVRLTGKSKTTKKGVKVELPEYISKLVREENINIQLTAFKCGKVFYVSEIDVKNNCFYVKFDSRAKLDSTKEYEFFWDFTAVRNDVDELEVEV